MQENQLYDQNRERIVFKRGRTQELFMILLEKKGQPISTEQLCDILWTDSNMTWEKKRNYFWQLMKDLRNTLAEIGDESQILKKDQAGYRIKMEYIVTV